MAANRRRVALLGLCIFALHILETQGGNPTDSASVSARNANNNSSNNNNTSSMNNNSGTSGGNTNTIACQEDELMQCPVNAACDKGRCVCMFRYRLNPAHHGKNATLGGSSLATATSGASTSSSSSVPYCLPDESNTTGGDNAANAQNEPASPQGGHAGQLPLREPPGAHHILGGVLIPLAFVVIMIGSALLAKRAQLWSRLRQRFQLHRNRHRRRPAYEDVVLVGFEPQTGRL